MVRRRNTVRNCDGHRAGEETCNDVRPETTHQESADTTATNDDTVCCSTTYSGSSVPHDFDTNSSQLLDQMFSDVLGKCDDYSKHRTTKHTDDTTVSRLFGFNFRQLTSWDELVRLLCRPTDPASLGTFRVMFGELLTRCYDVIIFSFLCFHSGIYNFMVGYIKMQEKEVY